MGASIIGWIWEESDRCKLSTGARLTLFALSEHTNIGEHGDWRVFPSQSRIARMVGVKDPKSIRRYMGELVAAGLVTFAHQHDDHGRQLQNLYWLSAPKLLGGEICPTGVGQNALQEGGKMPYKSLNKNPLISKQRSNQFEAWYLSYPKKQSKKAAMKAFMNLKADAVTACLADDLKARYKDTERQYIPLPSTYLNGERWEDELECNTPNNPMANYL